MVPWSRHRETTEDGRLFLLQSGKRAFTVILARAFSSPEEEERFRDLIRQTIGLRER
jgi:hypothetical protein